MAELDRSEVNARVVYWGCEGSGKTTSIRVISERLRSDHRGALRAMPTGIDPSVTYDLLPIELGAVAGVRTRIQIVGVPGGAELAPVRKQLLDRADGVVFVADTQPNRLEENVQSFEELREALAAYGRDPSEIPLVVQYNKRDLADPYAIEELHRRLGVAGVAAFEAVATDGTAVLQALTTVSKGVIRWLREHPDETPGGEQAPEVLAEPTPPPPDPDAVDDLDAVDELDASLELEVEPEPAAAPDAEVVALAEPLPPASLKARFSVVDVGNAELADERSVWLPITLADAAGKRVTLALTVSLDFFDAGTEDPDL